MRIERRTRLFDFELKSLYSVYVCAHERSQYNENKT